LADFREKLLANKPKKRERRGREKEEKEVIDIHSD